MRMRIPRVITIDQGFEFRNMLNREITALLGIEHLLTTAYHPQVRQIIKRIAMVTLIKDPPNSEHNTNESTEVQTLSAVCIEL